ncbi:parallel beta helix pectate lyase-like protein [Antricoccus suffuscus]|uniref:Parallel beta helix pectate lyase-like protein n=1 Tax=Antricoccus suffuscus TaxID=1629062 RepID=A0A2T0ZZJ4_9ACTN|nr:parallel beta helix pectate lyase-like protein [Antricoccus suffuscus]
MGDAAAGSTIVVASGSYNETVDVSGLDLTIAAAEGDEDVIIDGEDSYDPAIVCRRGELVLRGLTVRSDASDALRVTDTRLTVTKCDFSSKYASAVRLGDRSEVSLDGSTISDSQQGLIIEDTSGTIENLTIKNCADDAIVIRLGADPVLRNVAIDGSGHRGIYIYQSAKPSIEGCEVANTREEGILVAQGGAPKLNRCHVHDIQASGISFAAGTGGDVRSCNVERTAQPAIDIADGAEVTVHEGNSKSAGVGSVEVAKGDPAKVEQLLAELEQMVGLDGVKAEVKSIIDEIQVNEWRRSAGLNVDGMSNHLIFAGAPGTGKTTVGRIYGQLLAALGVLPGGPLREVSRRDLVGQYIGHTAEKTAAVFDEAKGGVVFLDEAYTLTRQAGSGGGDFGQEAVDMIVKLMEDMRKDIAVIAAGYTNEMREFLDANPGLASRFVKTIEFENYSAEDLTLIITRMINSGDYKVGDGAEACLLRHFQTIPRDENFGNARDARKLFEKLRKVQSQRLRTLTDKPTMDQLLTITLADVEVATGITGSAPASPSMSEAPTPPAASSDGIDSATRRWL